MQWCLNDIKVLVENLPEEIKALHHVSNEISARLLNQSQALKKLLGFVGFIYVIVTVATQVRPVFSVFDSTIRCIM